MRPAQDPDRPLAVVSGAKGGRQAHRICWLDAPFERVFSEPESGACQKTRMRTRYILYQGNGTRHPPIFVGFMDDS